MKPIYITIEQEATGKRIKSLMKERGFKVRQVQEAMGFENPQAVYKWLSGKSLPSLDSLVILCCLLGVRMDEILVIDGDLPDPDPKGDICFLSLAA